MDKCLPGRFWIWASSSKFWGVRKFFSIVKNITIENSKTLRADEFLISFINYINRSVKLTEATLSNRNVNDNKITVENRGIHLKKVSQKINADFNLKSVTLCHFILKRYFIEYVFFLFIQKDIEMKAISFIISSLRFVLYHYVHGSV